MITTQDILRRGPNQPLATVLHRFKVPALPHAGLRHASMIVALVRQRGEYEPDPFSSEHAFIADAWPRI